MADPRPAYTVLVVKTGNLDDPAADRWATEAVREESLFVQAIPFDEQAQGPAWIVTQGGQRRWFPWWSVVEVRTDPGGAPWLT